MSAPLIPPRPSARQPPPSEIDLPQQPLVPPRPASKKLERGTSPGGHNFSQSPFNEKYDPLTLTKTLSVETTRKRPSIATIPGLGSEGFEYGEVQFQPNEPSSGLAADAAAQTINVAEDLKLHAPKPSLPKASAVAQVQGVTRTDSVGAANHGIGRPPSQEGDSLARIRSRASISRPDSAASDERRRSIYEEGPVGQGGFRVPINPLLGDVQAPSPAPRLSPHHTGASGHESKPKRHHRTKSGREVFVPADSYGLHGHGMQPAGDLERDWYAKHPADLKSEETASHGVYEGIYSGRGAFALSSDDLNKIVRDTASRGSGFGTTGNVPSYPDEQIGYAASEQYSTRRRTSSIHKIPSNVQYPPESPLRKASLPVVGAPSPEVYRGVMTHENGSHSDIDDIHIGAPMKKYNKLTGGEETMNETEDVKPYVSHPTSENGNVDEHGYRVPILAEDEVAKEVGHEHLQPAVSPAPRRDSNYDDEYRTGSPLGSRPSSRPGSIYGMHSAMHSVLQRYVSHGDEREHVHTPLEDVDEYEPLFPDDADDKAVSNVERFKQRPETLRHRFPSQDIWEDTPDSAMYHATVSTPDLPHPDKPETNPFESSEAEHARKGEVSEEERKKLIPAEERLAKSKFAPHLRDDMPTRPGLQPRFPSKDIWEDSPDSQNLVTTVNEEQEPQVPQRPAESRLGEGASSQQIQPSITPNVPARPQKKVPSVPDRPKPQIPAKPTKKDSEELAKIASRESQESTETVTSPPIPKAKPQVPARPAGSKIASLRSNFMNDLNQKLGLGPPKEKEKEPEPEPEEVKPLEDARKARARGPQRRAPAKSPGATKKPTVRFAISMPQSVWHIDDSGALNMTPSKLSSDKVAQMENSTAADSPMAPTIDTTNKIDLEAEKRADAAPKPLASALSTNTAGEPTDPAPAGDSGALSKHTTSSTVSGRDLEREEIDPNTDAIPVSKQSTASDATGASLDRIESVDPATRTAEATVEATEASS